MNGNRNIRVVGSLIVAFIVTTAVVHATCYRNRDYESECTPPRYAQGNDCILLDAWAGWVAMYVFCNECQADSTDGCENDPNEEYDWVDIYWLEYSTYTDDGGDKYCDTPKNREFKETKYEVAEKRNYMCDS